jgi:hypothetical protein
VFFNISDGIMDKVHRENNSKCGIASLESELISSGLLVSSEEGSVRNREFIHHLNKEPNIFQRCADIWIYLQIIL